MNRKFRLNTLILLAVVIGACSQEATEDEHANSAIEVEEAEPGSLEQGLAVINRDGIEAHLRYLADDARTVSPPMTKSSFQRCVFSTSSW